MVSSILLFLSYHIVSSASTQSGVVLHNRMRLPESQGGFGMQSVIHLGMHGTVEWLPGQVRVYFGLFDGLCHTEHQLRDHQS